MVALLIWMNAVRCKKLDLAFRKHYLCIPYCESHHFMSEKAIDSIYDLMLAIANIIPTPNKCT
jgi:hypothetical protein